MSQNGGHGQHKSSRTSKASKAGLIFSVGRIARFLKNRRYSDRVGTSAPVYLAAALEYLTAEVLELAGNAARDLGKKRIKPRHIMLAVKGDAELEQMFRNVIIPNAGAIPHIHKCLSFLEDGQGDEITPANYEPTRT